MSALLPYYCLRRPIAAFRYEHATAGLTAGAAVFGAPSLSARKATAQGYDRNSGSLALTMETAMNTTTITMVN